MPKQRITKEMVVDAAFELARSGGLEQVMVKNIALALNCSVQPLYSYCKNIHALRQEVVERTYTFVREFATQRVDPKNLFPSLGRAYLQLAQEESHLFHIYVSQPRSNISTLEELYRASASPEVAAIVAESLHISPEAARALHMHMLVYTLGLGTIFSVTAPSLPAEEIFAQQDLAYTAFLKQVKEEYHE